MNETGWSKLLLLWKVETAGAAARPAWVMAGGGGADVVV
jgi:hypothetical protein